MIELGIDELTLVFIPCKSFLNSRPFNTWDWSQQANYLIHSIAEQSDFVYIFGDRSTAVTPPQGYITAFTFGVHDFYFSMGFHPAYVEMGIVLKFSAKALEFYLSKARCTVYEYLHSIQNENYLFHLSRIDFVADYINEAFTVTSIYNEWKNDKIKIVREYTKPNSNEIYFKKCNMEPRGFFTKSAVGTIYFGSSKSKLQLRIYDKRLEQLETKGSYLEKAKQCKSWIRFEAIFKDKYAKQITDFLLDITNDDEYANLIATLIYQKFCFKYATKGVIEDNTEFSQLLLDCISEKNYQLKSATNKNEDLRRSIAYLADGSGLFTTFFKVKSIWGTEGLKRLSDYFIDEFNNYEPNHDTTVWLSKYQYLYLVDYPTIDDFINNLKELKE